ncbi:hypothetical protein MWU65_07135 [Cellulophaga sp. F20128]|uniref:hypothetical protein n=1 Tax=Cellulophaga sp. F20128 TaxID=2926413 RepID=UPI001FF3F588|nr:hypothetical protein [Cellulophaga sp. F20128]MCK0156948.1 hypothetical protein [Cellulophaga sp. F20128]
MKKLQFLMATVLIFLSFTVTGQEKEANEEEKLSYYEQRAKEDAEFEQSKMAEVESEEVFWEDQKSYEKKLKKRDRKAYKAYMKGKRDAYAEHAEHCNSHCHHSEYYHHHTTFYYSYTQYRARPRNSGVHTRVGVSLPSVRIGL